MLPHRTGPGSSRAGPGFAGPGACPVDPGTGSRSQLLIDATSMVSLVDAFPLVVAGGHSPVLLELGKAPLGAVAVLVLGAVEGGRAAAGAAAAAAVGFLVFLDRDDRVDAALAQAGAVGRGGVRLIRERRAGPGARTALASPGDVEPAHQRDELRAVPALALRGDPGQRAPARPKWILVESPPRDRPSPSRPAPLAGFLSSGVTPSGGGWSDVAPVQLRALAGG